MKEMIIEDLQEAIAPTGASDSVGGIPCGVWLAYIILR